jgi:hypothetical protein
MSRTFTQDIKHPTTGKPITFEYSVDGSYSPTTYSPYSGADGGDAPEFCILKVWPNDEEYNRLHTERQALTTDAYGRELSVISISMMGDEEREKLDELDRAIEAADAACTLTDAEAEQLVDWLCEHYVEEPYEEDYF